MEDNLLYSDADFRRVQNIAMREAGIWLQDTKRDLVESRLARIVRENGCKSYAELLNLAESPGGSEILTKLVFAITTNVTNFFREKVHFDHLQAEVIAPAAGAIRKGKRFRVWSSACSSGQEGWTMAMSVMNVILDASQYDVKILGTDINADMVKIARSGSYRRQDTDGIPEALKKKWLLPASDDHLVFSGDIRALPTFNPMNLNGEWPFRGAFDAIFCRNVVIYFDAKTKARLWERLSSRLNPGGFIYVGHSERIGDPLSCGLEPVSSTIYRKIR
ncbi:chemotaxis protein CheR [Acetobacter malorum DSM 14337]|uniref:Chemotaxis protein methyltransferase n=1 Tax=Acetobacter malorum DSM 14337 TaxID=1307910 RepID=A0ABQ0PZ65_9PROT|nr:CheR family methyltransferase [Acetobacter malorum]KXV05616.1 hypothetical protein AD930_10750 [Acetobacter malorum]GBQ85238.1 chemotaxis protein CheR [Acetobacter malorum DSM 14337]